MALDEVTDAQLPFGMGEVDLLSVNALFAFAALALGFMLFAGASEVGAQLWTRVRSALSSLLGVNVGGGGGGITIDTAGGS